MSRSYPLAHIQGSSRVASCYTDRNISCCLRLVHLCTSSVLPHTLRGYQQRTVSSTFDPARSCTFRWSFIFVSEETQPPPRCSARPSCDTSNVALSFNVLTGCICRGVCVKREKWIKKWLIPPLEKNISSEQKGKERLHKSAGRRSSGGDEVIDSHGVQSFKDRGKKNQNTTTPEQESRRSRAAYLHYAEITVIIKHIE